jgi:hypothetical protein
MTDGPHHQDQSNAPGHRTLFVPRLQHPYIAEMYTPQQQLAYAPTPYSYTPSSHLAASINLDAVSQPEYPIEAGALSLMLGRRK